MRQKIVLSGIMGKDGRFWNKRWAKLQKMKKDGLFYGKKTGKMGTPRKKMG